MSAAEAQAALVAINDSLHDLPDRAVMEEQTKVEAVPTSLSPSPPFTASPSSSSSTSSFVSSASPPSAVPSTPVSTASAASAASPDSANGSARPRRRQRVSYTEVEPAGHGGFRDWDVERLNQRMLKEAIARSMAEAAPGSTAAAATATTTTTATLVKKSAVKAAPASTPSPPAAATEAPSASAPSTEPDAASASASTPAEVVTAAVDEQSSCAGCGRPTLCTDPVPILICDKCEAEWHQMCIQPPLAHLPGDNDEWLCPNCAKKKGRKRKDGEAGVGAAKDTTPGRNLKTARKSTGPKTKAEPKGRKSVDASPAKAATSGGGGAAGPGGFEFPEWCQSESERHRFSTMFAHYSRHYPTAPASQIVSTISAYWDDETQQPPAQAESATGKEEKEPTTSTSGQEVKEDSSAHPSASPSASAARHTPSPPAPAHVSLSTTIPSLPASATAAVAKAAPPAPSPAATAAMAARLLPTSAAPHDPESVYRLSYSIHQQDGGGKRRCFGVGCGQQEGDVLFSICGQCLVACYCSRDCQARHWKAGHKQECQALGQAFQQKISA